VKRYKWEWGIALGSFLVCLAGMMVIWTVDPEETVSRSERRRLAEKPELTWESLADKSFMDDTEQYLLDHFPFRDGLRRIKAYFAYDVLQQKENNDIYVVQGHAAKLEYPLNESSVKRLAAKMTGLWQQYFPEQDVWYAVVPDKNYFLAEKNGYPSMDYERMIRLLSQELAKNAVTRYWHKQKLKKQYAKQARQAAKQTAKQGAKAAGKTAAATEKLAERAVAFVKRHPVGALIALACVVLVLSLQSCASSLITLGNAAAGAVGATTYPAQDGDMLGAEAAYCSLEAELQHYLDTYESTHDYDEYHFDLDAIEHDPYVLISLLSAWHEGEWTLADVQPTLQMLFDRQYTLTENVVKERRYYIETDTWTDEEGNTHTDSYRVYYDYYICTVTLDNFNLSHLPIYIMGEEKVSRYSLYMATLGNRPDLFPGSSYVGKYTSPPEGYEVPGEYLDDETFAAMLSEAEKYLGYPYVWGGSSPATSFDCSGFVSWVVNHSGWNVGRLGAQGLYNICTRTSSPRPGDLVFFKGTYDTPGVSHCGIYVGDGMMLHCGDPIQYANLNSSYWQAHFYAYGRLP